MIQLKGDDDAELINVSRQRLSKCNVGMEQSTPWVGHSNKLRKRRQIRTREAPKSQIDNPEPVPRRAEPMKITRSGRQVTRPARYLLMTGPVTRYLIRVHKWSGQTNYVEHKWSSRTVYVVISGPVET